MKNKRVKVVQLITTMADGGAETLVKDYALLCDKEKIDLKVIVWSRPLGTANEGILRDNGIPVTYLGSEALGKTSNNPIVKAIRVAKRFKMFRDMIVKEDVDVIHVHLRFGMYLKILPDRVLKKVRLFYTLHNEPEKYFDPNGSGKKKFEYKETKRLIDRYGLTVITLHDDMNKQVRELFNTKNVITVNNGINFERFDRTLYDRKSIRSSLNIPDDAKVIGHVGSYTEQKNHEFLLRLFAEYLKKDGKARLLLVGRGVLKERITGIIKDMGLQDNIISLENRSDIPALMCTMDVFVLPSRWEGFPVVLLEAQKIGLKCVISDRINKEVVLSDDVTMLDIDGSLDRWIEAIDDNSKKEKPIGRFEDYDIRKSINTLEDLYTS